MPKVDTADAAALDRRAELLHRLHAKMGKAHARTAAADTTEGMDKLLANTAAKCTAMFERLKAGEHKAGDAAALEKAQQMMDSCNGDVAAVCRKMGVPASFIPNIVAQSDKLRTRMSAGEDPGTVASEEIMALGASLTHK